MDELTIDDLPAEILVMIFSLIPECILEIRGVCKRWKTLEENDMVYTHPKELTSTENIIELCRIFPGSKNVKASLIGSADSVRSVSEQIQHLSIIDMNISGIFSLHLFTNLTYLNISREKGASMTDTSRISNLKKLTYLNMDGQGIGWLNGLEELTELRYLNLSDTLISDITPLKNLTRLQELYLTNTSVENIDALSELTDIILLYLSRTIIRDISSISKLTKLEVLNISSTHVSDVSCLSRFSKLRYLDANYTQVTDLSPLSDLTALCYLMLWSVGRPNQGRIDRDIDFTCLMKNEGLSIMTTTGIFRVEGGKICRD